MPTRAVFAAACNPSLPVDIQWRIVDRGFADLDYVGASWLGNGALTSDVLDRVVEHICEQLHDVHDCYTLVRWTFSNPSLTTSTATLSPGRSFGRR